MNGYLELLELIAPVFLIVLLGLVLRQRGVLTEQADASILRLVVNVLYPCLIIRSVLGANSLKNASNVIASPLVGLMSLVGATLLAFAAAKVFGFKRGAGLRTFCFSVGICNYGYIPIPLIERLYGEDELAVLFVHNAGLEFGIWSIGIAVVSGAGLRAGLRKAINPSAIALVGAVLVNLLGWEGAIPSFLIVAIKGLASCALPLGLIMIGATISEYIASGERLWDVRSSGVSVALKFALIPIGLLAAASWLPVTPELKRVMIIQAAMPAGIMPIALAKHYGGRAIVALRIVIATTIVGIFAIPLWIRLGERFVFGVAP